MRNAKRWLALSLAGVMTVGMFAGCGSKSETKDDTAAKGDTAKESKEATSKEEAYNVKEENTKENTGDKTTNNNGGTYACDDCLNNN